MIRLQTEVEEVFDTEDKDKDREKDKDKDKDQTVAAVEGEGEEEASPREEISEEEQRQFTKYGPVIDKKVVSRFSGGSLEFYYHL
jgi:hypothetical protein